MKPSSSVAAYILNRRVYKESSLIVDVFTPEFGRLSLIANSALKNKKGWSAMLQVFQPLLIGWTGRSSLKTLVSVEAPSASIPLKGHKLFSAYYLNELILKLIPQEDAHYQSTNNESLFIAYSHALNELVSSNNLELPLRLLEYTLLNELGVFPDLENDAEGREIYPEDHYYYIPQVGFHRISDAPKSQPTAQVQLAGEDISKIARLQESDLTDAVFLRQTKRFMRLLIHELLGGKELKSRALFQSYQPYKG